MKTQSSTKTPEIPAAVTLRAVSYGYRGTSQALFLLTHGIGNRSRKGMPLIPCPWTNSGES
ncbi:hypothetical protein ACFL7E_02575 [Thermodesulfobacteriota bacterium]